MEVEQLRQWYQSSSLSRQRSPDHLEAIHEKGIVAKEHGTVEINQTEASAMSADLAWLAEHSTELKPVSLEMMREWWRANTVVAEANYGDEIKAIAQPLKEAGVSEITLNRSDHQRMLSDVMALRSTIAEGTLAIWQELGKQNRIVQTSEGQAYRGKEYDIVQSGHTLTLTNRETEGRFVIKNDHVEANTLSLSDVEKISAVVVDTKPRLKERAEMHH